MLRFLLIAFLVAVTSLNKPQDSYFISPPLPPSAFINQYYTAQFRVVGLDRPRFVFSHIPKFFKATQEGTIQGTPTETGSFPLNITFKALNRTITKSVVIRVVESTSKTSEVKQAVGKDKFMITNPNITLTYIAGNYINIHFKAINGKKPYLWTFTQLPPGLMAGINGQVNGSFIQKGYYTFAVSASDNAGSTADSFVTINVQPKGTNNNSIIQVPSRNVQLQYDLEKIQQQEIQATRAVYSAIHQVYKLQNYTNRMREIVANTTHRLTLAVQLEHHAQEKVEKMVQIKEMAQSLTQRAEGIVRDTTNKLQLAFTNLKNSKKNAVNVLNSTKSAKIDFQQAETNLTQAVHAFTKAQKQSYETALLIKQSITLTLDAYSTYNFTFQSYHLAKQILQRQLNKKTKADVIVQSAVNEVQMANSVNDNAQAKLTVAQDNYQKSASAFQNTLQSALGVGHQFDQSKQKLGVAKFNLQQANNRLFVAQAIKEQADKATAIVAMSSAVLPKDPKARSTFKGCDPANYPSMMGSDQIEQSNSFGLKLSSGHILVYGDCTKKPQQLNVGDVISYRGYLNSGQIQCLQMQLLKL